jgi:anti-sigma factor RsiW
MSDRKREIQIEKLSAFLDGELSEQEQNTFTQELSADRELQAQLMRFQVVSAQLHREETSWVDSSPVADLVSARLENEPTVFAPRKHRPGFKVPRMAIGAALAATVAAVAVSVAPQLLESGSEPLPQETFAFSPRLSVPAVDATRVALGNMRPEAQEAAPGGDAQRWKLLQPDQQHRLNEYLLEHNEFAGRLSVTNPNVHVGFISSENVPD